MTNDGILWDLTSGNQTWLGGTSNINRVNMEVLIRKKHTIYTWICQMDLPNGFAIAICILNIQINRDTVR